MGIKTFWYLTQADGDYPWSPDGLFPVDGTRQIELAKTIDEAVSTARSSRPGRTIRSSPRPGLPRTPAG